MSLLFLVTSDGTAVLHPDVVKLCPSLSALSTEELLYVIKYADYNSPYKQYPEHERQRRAMWDAFGDNETALINSARVQVAVQDYISLQYNPKIETARVYQLKIDKLQQDLLSEDSPAAIKKLGDAIDDLTKRIGDLERDYVTQMQKQGVIKGDQKLSRLEILQSNQKLYLSVISRNKK